MNLTGFSGCFVCVVNHLSFASHQHREKPTVVEKYAWDIHYLVPWIKHQLYNHRTDLWFILITLLNIISNWFNMNSASKNVSSENSCTTAITQGRILKFEAHPYISRRAGHQKPVQYFDSVPEYYLAICQHTCSRGRRI